MSNVCPVTKQPCGKMKNIRVSEVVNKHGVTFLLCGQCANSYYNENNLVFLKDKIPAPVIPPIGPCPSCKSTIPKLKEIGRLGCLNCFQHFGATALKFLDKGYLEPPEEPVVEEPKIYDSIYSELKSKLDEAIQNQKYEEAAPLHKRIKEIEIKMDQMNDLQTQLNEAVISGDFETAEGLRAKMAQLSS